MAEAARSDGDFFMIIVEKKLIPAEILKDSVLLHLAAAYFSVGRALEQKTQCSQTRGFILSTLRGGAARNQNQIATMLGLVSERKAETGRALLVHLTPKGARYREYLIRERQAADEKLRKELTPEERATLIRLLKVVAGLEF